MTTKRSSDPVANCSQPFRNQKGKNFVWKKEDPLALRKLMLLKATKKLVGTLSAILSVISCSKKIVIPTSERKWITIDANPSHGGGHKDDTSSRTRRTRTRWIISLGYRAIGVAEGVYKERSRINF